MKKILLGSVALIAMTASAMAADLAARPYTKAPPMAVAYYDWSGFYIGANGGYASARKCWTQNQILGVNLAIPLAEGCHNADGGVIGGQFGYRWQTASWVWGIEGQGDWMGLRGQNVSTAIVGATNRTRIDALGLFTGSVGMAWNNVLLSVRGGYAVVGERYAGLTTATGVVFDNARETRSGAAVGVGLEFGVTQNISLGVNYDHVFLGSRNLAFTAVAPLAVPSRIDRIREDIDMVTARINYRWGGPVVAKY